VDFGAKSAQKVSLLDGVKNDVTAERLLLLLLK
jgi:hypothetical protein